MATNSPNHSATALHMPDEALLPALAHWCVNMPAISAAQSHQARLSLVDTVACIVAGQNEDVVHKVKLVLCRDGASGRSRPVFEGLAMTAGSSALINGTAGHALDFDDYETPASTHPSVVLVSALLALAELHPVTLDQMDQAYIAGYEAICRMGEALGYGHYERGWHATGTIAPIGAALACARLLGLSAAQATAAMSIAATMSAGLKAQFGTETKALHAGLAARSGLEAAAWAGAGLHAAPNVMEGPFGFVALYGTAASPGPVAASHGIGEQLAITQYPPVRKPWPCCAYTHRAIAAALALTTRAGVAGSAIDTVEINMPEPYLRVSPFLEPATVHQARFSVVHCVAAALTDGAVSPASFNAAALLREDLKALRVRTRAAPYALPAGLGDMSPDAPDSVTIRMADGRTLTEVVSHAPGGCTRPLGDAEVLRKFTLSTLHRRAQAVLEADGASPFRWSGFGL